MIMREVQRRPLRLLLSALGIAMAIGIVVVSRFMVDAMKKADAAEIIRVTAAEALGKIAMGKNVHHKGGPFGVPALIKALQDNGVRILDFQSFGITQAAA